MVEDADIVSEESTKEPSVTETEDLKAHLQEALNLAEERLDLLMRCRADLDNVIKRSAKEREDNVKYASEKLILKLLPVLDSLDQASKHDEGTKLLLQQ